MPGSKTPWYAKGVVDERLLKHVHRLSDFSPFGFIAGIAFAFESRQSHPPHKRQSTRLRTCSTCASINTKEGPSCWSRQWGGAAWLLCKIWGTSNTGRHRQQPCTPSISRCHPSLPSEDTLRTMASATAKSLPSAAIRQSARKKQKDHAGILKCIQTGPHISGQSGTSTYFWRFPMLRPFLPAPQTSSARWVRRVTARVTHDTCYR